jgi:hypothetical protein
MFSSDLLYCDLMCPNVCAALFVVHFYIRLRMELHIPAALVQTESPWNELDRTLGGFQSQSERCGEEKNVCLCRESNFHLSFRSLVTVVTELSSFPSYSSIKQS